MSYFRKELLRTDIIPRKLNEVSKKYKMLLLKDLEENFIKIEEVTVCLCGSKKLEQLTKVDRFGLPFGSLICQECGLITTSPRIKEGSLSYYYDRFYHPLNYGKESLKDHKSLYADGQGEKIFNILKSYLPKKNKIKVLEIGAGTGNVLEEFKRQASSINIEVNELGTEYSNDCIEKCNEAGLNVIFGNLQTIVEKKIKFDVIILSHVFEHFTNLDEEINRIKKLMFENSLLYIECPGVFSIHKKPYYDFKYPGYHVHAHMYNFTKNTLENVLGKKGLKSIYSNNNIELVLKNGISSIIANDYSKILNYLDILNDNTQFRNQTLTKLELMIEYRDAEIKKLSTQVSNRDAEIKKLSTQVSNRDAEIKKLSTQVSNRDAEIKKLSKT